MRGKKVEEDQKSEEVNYKDIKKGGKLGDNKDSKPKYEYVEEDSYLRTKPVKNDKVNKFINKWASVDLQSESDKSESESEVLSEEQ